MNYFVKWTQCVWVGEDDYDFESRSKSFDSYADAFEFMDMLQAGKFRDVYEKGRPHNVTLEAV